MRMNRIPRNRRKIPIPDEMDQKDRLLCAVNGAAEILLTADEESFESSLYECMKLMACCMEVDHIYIWQNKMKDGILHYIQQFEWLGGCEPNGKTVRSKTGFSYAGSMPEWEEKFLQGECVNGPLSNLSHVERKRLEPYGIKSILVIPVYLQNFFWGFVSFDDCHQERFFTEDEISILRSANLMLASSLDRHETAARIREADERAKLMLDATPLCCSLWDKNFNLIDCNEESVKFYGLKDKQEYLDRFFELLPERQPDGTLTLEKLRKHIADAFREGRIVFEWMHQTLDGAPAPKEVTLTRIRQGNEFIVASYTRDLREFKKIMRENEYKSRLLRTVNGAAEILLTANEKGFEDSLREAMALMARCMDIDRMYIWQNIMQNGNLRYIQQFEWLGDHETKGETVRSKTGFSYTDSIPEWEIKLLRGECINGPLSRLSSTERERLEPYGIKSILVIPVYLQDHFWGFVSFDDCQKERAFTGDEISILRSASLMLASAMDRHETAARIREADECAKLMLDATPLCCSLWDSNFNIIDCNEEAVNFFGLKNKQEFLHRFSELFPKFQPDGHASLEKAQSCISDAFYNGKVVVDFLHQKLDGTPVPMEVTLVRVKHGDGYIVAEYVRDLREHKKMMNAIEYKDTLLHMANNVAEILLTADEERFKDSLREGMALMARCMEVDCIYIWQNKMVNGNLQYIQQYEWLGNPELDREIVRPNVSFFYDESIPEWETKFLKGECVNGPLSSLSQTERQRLEPYGIKSILVIPVFLQDLFWGFVSFDDCHQERVFTEDEINILRSANLMLASAISRHETAARVREADEHTKLMLDATPLCCSLWDRNLNLIDCNAAVVDFFGLKDKQEYLDRFFELSPEYQPDGSHSTKKALENIAAAFHEDRNVYEWMHRMPDGSLVPTEITIVRVRRGDEIIVAGYTRDLREYKKMMQAIEYKDALLHMTNDVAGILLRPEIDEFENDIFRCLGMIAGSVGVDRMYICKNYEKDGQLYTNQLYEWSGGAEPQMEITQNVLYSEKAPGWEEKLSNDLCINALVRDLSPEEQAQLSPQGILSILAVPVLLRDQFWGFVGFDDCHRERIFSEQEESILRSASLLIANALLRNEMTHDIRAAVEQAQAASKAKSAFLAHMSHEIRTPMNVISGMTELMLREDVPAAIYEYVMSIKQASTNMLSLINDILDFSKIEAGNLDMVSAEYSLTSLINNVLIITRMKVSEKPVLFTTNIDCNIPNRLIGDEMRIRQILLNVLDNAAKYTNEGFVSLVVTGEIEEGMVILSAEISDSGVGIRKEDISKMFDDFIRIDSGQNKSVQGTGLGLAITKSLCQAMGGNISVSSEYGMGSTFIITIPQKIKSHDEKFANVSDPDTKPVLLLETRSIYSISIVRSLDNLGVRCTLVKTQQEFYEELKHRFYPFVFVPSLLSVTAGQIIEELRLDTTLVLLTEFGEAPSMNNVRTIAMPVHSASIANILDDIDCNIIYSESGRENVRFIAPNADILVVDDLNTNLKVTQGLMLPYQMQIDVCTSGEEAIEYAKRKRYDIIFMDHMMPGMDGIEATGRMRSMEDGSGYYANVPIIALSANAVSGVKEMFLRAGMNDFLAKPIDITKLHGLLEKWLPNEKKKKLNKAKALAPEETDQINIKIKRVDVKAGIAMTGGSVGAYLKTLAVFHMDALDKTNKIRDCMDKNDIRSYTVYAHALKSAAANIGAGEISELFKTLEAAGAREDVAFIRKNTNRFLEEMETLLENIYAVVSINQGEQAKEKDPEVLKNVLLKLRDALKNRDAGEISDIMSILETVMWNQQASNIFKELSRSILMINYTDAVILVDKLLLI